MKPLRNVFLPYRQVFGDSNIGIERHQRLVVEWLCMFMEPAKPMAPPTNYHNLRQPRFQSLYQSDKISKFVFGRHEFSWKSG
jgi:hypothetical protein